MVEESFVSRSVCSFWTSKPASHRSVLITHINCGLLDLPYECICLEALFSANSMKISNMLSQEEQFKYHLHTFELGLNIN